MDWDKDRLRYNIREWIPVSQGMDTKTYKTRDPNFFSNRAKTLVPGSDITIHPHLIALAGQVVSTGRDMTRFLRIMLNGGTIDGTQILTRKTVNENQSASLVA